MDGVTHFVGIDVAKATLEIAILPEKVKVAVGKYQTGINKLIKHLGDQRKFLFVVEATGGYERLVVAMLIEVGLQVAVVNPRQPRNFPRGFGKLSKLTRSMRCIWLSSHSMYSQGLLRKHLKSSGN